MPKPVVPTPISATGGGGGGRGGGLWAGTLGSCPLGGGACGSLSTREPGLLCSGGRTGTNLRLEPGTCCPAHGIAQRYVARFQFPCPLGFKRCLSFPRCYRGWAPAEQPPAGDDPVLFRPGATDAQATLRQKGTPDDSRPPAAKGPQAAQRARPFLLNNPSPCPLPPPNGPCPQLSRDDLSHLIGKTAVIDGEEGAHLSAWTLPLGKHLLSPPPSPPPAAQPESPYFQPQWPEAL